MNAKPKILFFVKHAFNSEFSNLSSFPHWFWCHEIVKNHYSRYYHSLGHEKVRESTFTVSKANDINTFNNFEIFFPQMKPEKKAPSVELNDEEKALLK